MGKLKIQNEIKQAQEQGRKEGIREAIEVINEITGRYETKEVVGKINAIKYHLNNLLK